MREIVEEVKKELDEEQKKKVKSFVKTKLERKKYLEEQIDKLDAELAEVHKAIARIEEGDYSEVGKYSTTLDPTLVTWTNGTAYPYTRTVSTPCAWNLPLSGNSSKITIT